MTNVKIGRYDDPTVAAEFPGYIEGTADDGSTWIIWLGSDGKPSTYYPHRDQDGAVIGDPILLSA